MRRSAAIAFGLAAAAGLSCSNGAQDTADRVHDLRVLAFRADPPDQVLRASFQPDGGMKTARLPPDGGAALDGGLGPALAITPITVTALVADPAGAGRDIHCRWTTCAQTDGTTGRCEDASPMFAVLGVADVVAGVDGAEPAVTFTPDTAMLFALQQVDPYRGLRGLWHLVQLEVTAGDENVVAQKRAVVTLSVDEVPPPPNRNPVLDTLRFDDEDWAPDAEVTFASAVRSRTGFGPLSGTAPAPANKVEPIPDPALAEDYTVTTFDGQTKSLHEAWRYNFFTTQGSFSRASTGATSPLDTTPPLDTRWQALAPEDGGLATVWVVVRDGRGGESWLVRHAQAPEVALPRPGR